MQLTKRTVLYSVSSIISCTLLLERSNYPSGIITGFLRSKWMYYEKKCLIRFFSPSQSCRLNGLAWVSKENKSLCVWEQGRQFVGELCVWTSLANQWDSCETSKNAQGTYTKFIGGQCGDWAVEQSMGENRGGPWNTLKCFSGLCVSTKQGTGSYNTSNIE